MEAFFYLGLMQPRTDNFPYPQPAGSPSPVASEPTTQAEAVDVSIQFPDGTNEATFTAYAKTRNAVFQTWFDSYIKKVAELHKMFRNAPTGSKVGKVVQLPVASGIVESINARLQPALLNRPKIVEAVPNFQVREMTKPQLIEDFVNQTVLEITRRPEKGKQAIKSAVVETMLIWRNVWKQEKVLVSEPVYIDDPLFMPNPMDPNAMPEKVYQGERELEINRQYWDWELESLGNMAWEPHTVTRLSDSPWARKRAQLSYNDLLRRQAAGMFKGVERLKLVVPAGASGQMKEGWEDELKRAAGDKNWNFAYADEKLYQVEEWWADMTWTDGAGKIVQKKMVWFMVEGAYVVGLDENFLRPQRLPWDSCPLIQDPHAMTGLSPLDVVMNLQTQINTYAGYQDTLTERMAKPTIFYDESSGLSSRTSFMRTYGLQPVQNVQGIKEMTLDAGPLQAVQAYITFLIDLMRDASGANEQFQGMGGSDTATEFEGLVAAAGSRFADVVDTLSQGWLEALGNECFLFNRQFGQDGEMFVRAANTEGETIALTRGDFSGEYVFVATSSATEKAKTQEMQAAMQAIELGAKLPPSPDGMIFDAQKAYKDIILPLLGMKSGKDWFTQAPMPQMGAAPSGEMPQMPMGAGVENGA